jgi:hypothetical protein
MRATAEIARDDAASPTYLSLPQAARLLPPGRSGRPVHIATLIRWITNGTRTRDGRTVRLKAVRMGSRWLTSQSWLDEYAASLTPAYSVEGPRPSTVGRGRSAERDARELDKIGI